MLPNAVLYPYFSGTNLQRARFVWNASVLVKRFIACLCYCKIAPWLFIRPTGRVFVEVNNAARQRKGRKANIRNVSSVMILLAGVKRESVSFSFSFPAWFQRYRRYFFQTKQNFGLVEEVHEQEWYRSRTLWCIQLYHGVGISAYL